MFFFIFIIYDYLFFFFFKQKTAYDMRISDWSSDVCSSDLCGEVPWLRRFPRATRKTATASVAPLQKPAPAASRTSIPISPSGATSLRKSDRPMSRRGYGQFPPVSRFLWPLAFAFRQVLSTHQIVHTEFRERGW